MFTGIIESLGVVKSITKDQENVHFTIESDITNELKIDQSVAHNGVCLTVVDIQNRDYVVTAIKETLVKTNLHSLKIDDVVNLERAMKLGERLDGHIVQGHVDTTGVCIGKEDEEGSTLFTFTYSSQNDITIEKGSITVNGVSLTVVNSKRSEFSVAIIPYTLEHTMFKNLQIDDSVNLEFDVIGKYVAKLFANNR
ncbi:riboflavin synthase [Flavobacteriaceae bacterium S356]|uniref:Riboflavin synthase n=1 Tax=Asprobacillus argus TaxID=3076534 RepID=A0ABU3LFZ2_9FLAO|nr:riboflavin synthase [Flavobacteriaceae bacterium S356]